MRIFAAVTVILFSSSVFAKDVIPQGQCRVRQTNEVVEGSQFFLDLFHESNRHNNCIVGHVVDQAKSARVFVNGRRASKEESLSIEEVGRINFWGNYITINLDGELITCQLRSCKDQTSPPPSRPLYLR